MDHAGITSDFTFQPGPLRALGQALQASGYRFVTPTPATLERVNGRPGNEQARTVVDVFGWNRPFRQCPLPPALEQAAREAGVLVPFDGGYRAGLRFSSLGGALYAHSPFPTESPDSVFFGPDSYRFSLAIEQELQLGAGTVRRALDLGCGAGPGAITVASRVPSARVEAVDVNARALALCDFNATLAGRDNVFATAGDLFEGRTGHFDLIVANPPYLLDSQQRTYRHGGGRYGEALSVRIVEGALERLAPGGRLLLYTGVAIVNGRDPLLERIETTLRRRGWQWEYTEIDPDVFGEELARPAYESVDRIAVVVLKVRAP